MEKNKKLSPNELAVRWLETHWVSWYKNDPLTGPLTTFTVAGGLLTYVLVRNQHGNLVVYVLTGIGATFGYAVAYVITASLEDWPGVGHVLHSYGKIFTKEPAFAIGWTAAVTLLGTGILQIFGGEILDFIPGVNVIDIGFEVALSMFLGLVTMDAAYNFFASWVGGKGGSSWEAKLGKWLKEFGGGIIGIIANL